MNARIFSFKEMAGVGLTACLISSLCLFEPAYIHYLRQKFRTLFPQQWEVLVTNGSTNLLVPWVSKEDEMYASKVNQIRVHGRPVDPFLADSRDRRHWMTDSVSFYALAALAWPFHDLQTAWAVIPRLLMGFWFLLFYFLFRSSFSGDAYGPSGWALAALFPLCFVDAINYLNIDFSRPNVGLFLYKLIFFGFRNRSYLFFRMSSPCVTFLFVFGWFFLVMRYMLGARQSVLKSLAVGCCGAALAFVHFFDWTFAMGTLGVVWAASWGVKPFSEYRRTLGLLFMAGAAASLLFGLVLGGKVDPSVLLRAGLSHSRKVHPGAFFLLGMGALAAWHATRVGDRRESFFWAFMGSSVIAGALLSNANVLTGLMLQNDLYFRNANFSLGVLAGGALMSIACRRAAWRPACATGVLLMMLMMFFNLKSASEKIYLAAGLPQSWEDAFRWVGGHVPVDGKILSLSPVVTKLLPVYTPAKLQVADGFPLLSTIPTEANLVNMGVLLKTLNVDSASFLNDRFLDTGSDELAAARYFFGGCFSAGEVPRQSWAGFLLHWAYIDNRKEQALAQRRIESYARAAPPLTQEYYVWLDSGEERYLLAPLASRGDLQLVYQNAIVKIYRHSAETPLAPRREDPKFS